MSLELTLRNCFKCDSNFECRRDDSHKLGPKNIAAYHISCPKCGYNLCLSLSVADKDHQIPSADPILMGEQYIYFDPKKLP